jgi:hydrogenase maturation protease
MTEAPGLIIGYGNTLRGDDGIGYHIAEALGQRIDFAQVLARHQLTVELADDIARAAWVVFVDADAQSSPGKVTVHPVAADSQLPRMFTHHLTPAALLACTQQFFGSAPPAWLLAIGSQSMDFSHALTLDSASVHAITTDIKRFATDLDRRRATLVV